MGEVPLYQHPADTPTLPGKGLPEGGFSSSRPPREGTCMHYRGTLLIRKRTLLAPYHRLMPRVIRGSQGSGRSLMGEVPLYMVAMGGGAIRINEYFERGSGRAGVRSIEMCSGSEAGSYLRLIDFCMSQL